MKYIIYALLLVSGMNLCYSRAFRVYDLPNGKVFSCQNCHVAAAGDGPRNVFGQDVEANFLDVNGDVVWGPELAHLDSDGDGFTNGQELQDPDGKWVKGSPNPGNLLFVTLPGDPNSKPQPTMINNNYFNTNTLLNIKISSVPPFQHSINIIIESKKESMAKMKIFSIEGYEVYEIPELFIKQGSNSIPFDCKDNNGNHLPSDIYFLKIEIDFKAIVKPFVLVY